MAKSDPRDILVSLASRGIRPGLATMRATLAALGDPLLPPAVLIAGTDGKGSTAALLATMARAAGYHVGLFTSPPLERIEEQIRVDGAAIASAELATLLERAVAAAETARPGAITAFEALTAAALLRFADAGVELAVLEAGMGGAGDATNVVEPRVSVLTTVGLDHREHLGATLVTIAREKAGILRRGRPGIVGWLDAEAEAAVCRVAEERGAPLRLAREAVVALRRDAAGLASQRVELETDRGRYRLELPLAGAHQTRNLALAVLAAEALQGDGLVRLDGAAITRGAAVCRWPGRLERRVAGGRELILDGAHNATAVAALVAFLDELDRPFDLLFAAFRDKDVDAMLPPLLSRARRALLTGLPGPRGWDPAVWAARHPATSVDVEPDLERALERMLVAEDVPLVVCGSLSLVAAVRGLVGAGAEG